MINIDALLVLVVGAGFTYIGIDLRKKQKDNWRACLVGGITIMAIVILALIFGWKL
jgi:hypothetical protein